MKIKFENGSSVETLESKDNNFRSKSSGYIHYLKENPSEFIYLTTGKRLPLWHRIWVDKICPKLHIK